MRALFALLLLFSAPAAAATYALSDPQGQVNCVEWDGVSAYVPPQGYTLAASPDCVPSPPAKSGVITRTAFLNRFTQAELTAISAAARTNDSINVWLITAQAADSINLADALAKQGLDALVTAGILTAAREAVVLTP